MRAYPFPLPNGWFQVAYADELPPGAVVPLRYFGRDLVLFRTESGRATVLDAHCPHLGAHLGHGGRVGGETIECPFHAWRFDADGQCVEIPYAQRIPPKGRTACWPVVERNRIVWVWHHKAGLAPDFEVPDIPEATAPDWTDFERHRWRVRTRNQEMGENAVDRAHFRYVHGTATMPDTEVEFDGPVRRALNRARLTTPRGVVEGTIDSRAYGMGCSTTRFSGICETLLIGSVTPIDDTEVDVRFSFTQRSDQAGDGRSRVAGAIVADICRQLEEDIPIWEHKAYMARPVLCDGDGPIGAFRRWCRQFY